MGVTVRAYDASSSVVGNSMAISHELSSEIAAALFAARDRSPRELRDLKEILLVIHSTLQKLTDDARLARLGRLDSESGAKAIAKGGSASS